MGLLLPPIASDIASVPVTKGLTQIWPLLLDRRDSRAFRVRPATSANEDTFDLLWISDSAMLVKDAPPEHRYRNMPQYSAIHPLAEYIKTIGGKKLVIHDYFITGMRSGDLRRVILHGISDPEIDAAIININPMMVFNDLMPFGISNQRMALYREHGLTGHDLTSALLSSRPGLFMFEAASKIWPLYAARFPLSRGLNRASNWLLPSKKPFPVKSVAKSADPWMVPLFAAWNFPEEVNQTAGRADKKYGGYTQMALISDVSDRGFGVSGYRDNLRSLAKWGKPAILYVPPLAAKYVRDPTYPHLDNVIRQIGIIAGQARAPNVRIVTATARAAAPDWLYFDGYHLRQGDVLVKLTADLLEKGLKLPIVRNDLKSIFGAAAPLPAGAAGAKK